MGFESTTDNIVAKVRTRAQLPDAAADGQFSDAEILRFADEELATVILPLIKTAREEYLVTSTDTSLVASQSDYRIPSRASSNALRSIHIVDSNGNESEPLDYIDLEDAAAWGAFSSWHGTRSAYTIEGAVVRLLPTPSASSGSVRFRFVRSLSRLVPVAECMAITGIAGAVLSGSEPGWSTSDTFELTQAEPPFDVLGLDLSASAVSAGTSVTLDDTPSSALAVGDYVSLAGETCIPQIPHEFHALLVAATVRAVLEAAGDTELLAVAEATLERRLQGASELIDPRIPSGRRIVNRYSPLRRGRRWGSR